MEEEGRPIGAKARDVVDERIGNSRLMPDRGGCGLRAVDLGGAGIAGRMEDDLVARVDRSDRGAEARRRGIGCTWFLWAR